MKFTEWLKHRRDALGMTQQQLADYLEISVATYIRLERGHKTATKIEEAGIRGLITHEPAPAPAAP